LHDTGHGIDGVRDMHGDGCFNHGLSVLLQALNSAGSGRQ
jgi:uncharacterized protein YidB (DUF937 family)